MNDSVSLTKREVKLLLSFCPVEKPPKGLDPTMYFTNTYEDDIALYEQITAIKEKMNGLGSCR